MKKRLCLLTACIACATLLFSGCTSGNDSQTPAGDGAASAYTSEDGLPAAEAELKELYHDAQFAYESISLGNISSDPEKTMEKDGYTYYQVTHPEYSTYKDFRSYLAQYFTTNFIETEVLSDENIMFAQDEEGLLYVLGGGRGTNIFYAGHVFHPTERDDDTITLNATAYYTNSNEPYEEDFFFTAPENPDDFTTQDFTFHLVQEDGQWRFDDFMLFY